MKSSAGNVGAVRVQALAEQVEAAAKAGQAEAVTSGLAELEKAFSDASVELVAAKLKLGAAPTNPSPS